jgi:hypothetical protein
MEAWKVTVAQATRRAVTPLDLGDIATVETLRPYGLSHRRLWRSLHACGAVQSEIPLGKDPYGNRLLVSEPCSCKSWLDADVATTVVLSAVDIANAAKSAMAIAV